MSRCRVVKQDVTEARRLFCRTMKEIDSSEEGEVVVIVHRRGDPLAAIISVAEVAQFFTWKAEKESAERPERNAPEDKLQGLPDDWPTPDEYARKCLSDGCSPEATAEGIVENYTPYGMTPEEAGRIVERVSGEEAADR